MPDPTGTTTTPETEDRTFTVRFLVNIRERGDALDDTMTDLIQELEDAVQRCRLDYTDIQVIEGNHLPYECPRGATQDLRVHRAQRRQRALDALREAAKSSASARNLLTQIDPRGDLRFIDDEGQPIRRAYESGPAQAGIADGACPGCSEPLAVGEKWCRRCIAEANAEASQ